MNGYAVKSPPPKKTAANIFRAVIESFLQPNFSSKRWQILNMGDNLEFHKTTFCGLFIYCFIRIRKAILGKIVLRDPQDLEFNPYFVENMAFASDSSPVVS